MCWPFLPYILNRRSFTNTSQVSRSRDKKTILYIVPNAGVGGVETFLQATWKYHDHSQFSPCYAVFRQGPLKAWLENQSAPVHLAPKVPRISRPVGFARTIIWLKGLIKSESVDVVHSTMAYGALFGGLATMGNSAHHLWFQHGPVGGWMDRAAALLPHDIVLTNSHHTRNEQLKIEQPIATFIAPHRKFEVLPLGSPLPDRPISLSQILEAKQQMGLGNKQLIVGMLCRLQKWKGVHMLIESLRLIKQQHPTFNIAAIIWGEPRNSEYAKGLQKLATDYKLDVIWPGFTDNQPLAMATIDILINASTTPEPFGLSITEAMASGKPVIAPNTGGPVDIVDDGRTGLLFKSSHSQDLADKIVELATNKDVREKMGQAGHELAKSKFNATTMIKTLEQFYIQLAP